MTKHLFGNIALSINIRNGVGFDLEFADSRPVFITSDEWLEPKSACFEGTVILLPFVVITLGSVHSLEEEL